MLRDGDRILGQWRLENLALDGELPAKTFALEPRPDQEVRTESEGSRRVDQGALAGQTATLTIDVAAPRR